jgi:penicillin V acylase-like amidase (Ntn superfamily)
MCTDFLLAAADRSVVNGRSMEFGLNLKSRPFVRRRGEVMRSPTPKKPRARDGLRWTVKYGYVGMNALGLSSVVDGMNERGLSVGTLWLPGSEYQQVKHPGRALSVLLVNDWLLGTCASVTDVKKMLPTVEVWAYKPMEQKLDPLHFAVHDARGHSIVIEYTGGKLHIYDNPIATLTNAPVFPWHLENVRNYVGLTPWDVVEEKVNGKKFTPTGHGSGLRGIPGDFTPPSRLIRTLFLMSAANHRAKNGQAARNLALHILNDIDIPKGVVRYKSARGKIGDDYTQWAAVKDLTRLLYDYRRYEDLDLRRIDLNKIDFGTIKSGPISEPPIGKHEVTEIAAVVA